MKKSAQTIGEGIVFLMLIGLIIFIVVLAIIRVKSTLINLSKAKSTVETSNTINQNDY
jgi:hypothetical protein